MQANIRILFDPVVETVGFPRLGEENKRHTLAEIIKRETACTYGIHDRSVMYDPGRDLKCTRTQNYVCVSRRPTESYQDCRGKQ